MSSKSLSIRKGLAILVAITALSLTGAPRNSARPDGECEKKKEACIKSCAKQRETCDKNNPNDSNYCVNQDKRCQKGCEDAWKKCSEKP